MGTARGGGAGAPAGDGDAAYGVRRRPGAASGQWGKPRPWPTGTSAGRPHPGAARRLALAAPPLPTRTSAGRLAPAAIGPAPGRLESRRDAPPLAGWTTGGTPRPARPEARLHLYTRAVMIQLEARLDTVIRSLQPNFAGCLVDGGRREGASSTPWHRLCRTNQGRFITRSPKR